MVDLPLLKSFSEIVKERVQSFQNSVTDSIGFGVLWISHQLQRRGNFAKPACMTTNILKSIVGCHAWWITEIGTCVSSQPCGSNGNYLNTSNVCRAAQRLLECFSFKCNDRSPVNSFAFTQFVCLLFALYYIVLSNWNTFLPFVSCKHYYTQACNLLSHLRRYRVLRTTYLGTYVYWE